MNILGVNYYQHNSSAALVRDGKLTAAAEEERFTRIKHDGQVPVKAIHYCLNRGKLKLHDLDLIAVSIDFSRLIREKYLKYTLDTFPKSNQLLMQNAENLRKLMNAEDALRNLINFNGRIEYFKHHICHLASSYFLSGYSDATLVSMDGLGEIETTVVAHGQGKRINVMATQDFPHSLGLLYQAICAYLGYRFGSEGTVMALASFGKGDAIAYNGKSYNEIFSEMVTLGNDGLFSINTDFFNFPFTKTGWVSDRFSETFGPHKAYHEPITQHHKNIAAGLQNVFEKSYLHIINHAIKRTGSKNLCLAGGCALNCVANGRIKKESDVKDIYIQPAANDAGAAIGAAFYSAAAYDKQMVLSDRRDTTYWGPSYTREYIRKLLKSRHDVYAEVTDPASEGAKLLSENKVIGWFQGRMEFGPRALGNRSILAAPNSIALKNRINETIKHRETFRPFAPSILMEFVGDYFKADTDSPFMLEACHIQPHQKEKIVGVIHVDDTSRLHVVTPERNRRYYDLIDHFFQLTGIPLVLNTSFNDKGEPIVCSPEDAIAAFHKLSLDALIIDNFLLIKEDYVQSSNCHQNAFEEMI